MAIEPKVPLDLSEARDALLDCTRVGKEAAEELMRIFHDAAGNIGRDLARAALGGKVSFRNLVGSILADLGRLAVDRIFQGQSPKPNGGGAIGGATTVILNVGAGADAESIRRNQAQIAGNLARAVDYGRRNA